MTFWESPKNLLVKSSTHLGCVFDTMKRKLPFLMDLCSNPKSKSHRQGLRKQCCSTARLSVLLKTVASKSSKSLGHLSKWSNQHQSTLSPSPKIFFHVDTAVIRIVRRFGDTQGASSGTSAMIDQLMLALYANLPSYPGPIKELAATVCSRTRYCQTLAFEARGQTQFDEHVQKHIKAIHTCWLLLKIASILTWQFGTDIDLSVCKPIRQSNSEKGWESQLFSLLGPVCGLEAMPSCAPCKKITQSSWSTLWTLCKMVSLGAQSHCRVLWVLVKCPVQPRSASKQTKINKEPKSAKSSPLFGPVVFRCSWFTSSANLLASCRQPHQQHHHRHPYREL